MEPQQLLLVCGVVMGPLFIIIFLIEGALRTGYYPLQQPVSALARGQRGWIQQANFFLAAALSFFYALGLHLSLSGFADAIMLPLLVCILGIGFLGAGIFVTDVSGLPEDYHKLAHRTRSGVVHDLFAIPVFGWFFVGFFVSASLSIAAGQWGFAIYSLLSALLFAPCLVFASAGFSGKPNVAPYGGLLQCITICIGFLWFTIVALQLLTSLS